MSLAVLQNRGAGRSMPASRPTRQYPKQTSSASAFARRALGGRDSAPSICVAAITGHSHVLRYEQTAVVSGRKPPGAVALQIFRALGDSFDVDAADARYLGTFTRNPIEIRLDQSEDLKVACYVARWISRRGVPGPWGNIVRQRISCDSPLLGSMSARRAA